MAIKIERLLLSDTRVRAALYYPVPPAQYLASSNDQNRSPAGVRLSAAEVQALKDGRLYEHIIELHIPPEASEAFVLDRLIRSYSTERKKAAQDYRDLYSSTNPAWDGNNWT